MPQFPKSDPLSGFTEIRPDGSPVEPAEPSQLVNDGWVAARLQMKVATIRSQRYRRRHGLDHWFDVDPVFIGSRPRYGRADIIAWLERQYTQSMNGTAPASGRP